jgi:HEAT repeat protein
MDDAEFDRLLPIEVVPQPARIKRFALVIVLNVDPAAGTIVDDLIKQLGDEDWSKRDAAYQALVAMGPAATAKLNAAKNNTDMEVVWRVERLLAQLPQQPAK